MRICRDHHIFLSKFTASAKFIFEKHQQKKTTTRNLACWIFSINPYLVVTKFNVDILTKNLIFFPKTENNIRIYYFYFAISFFLFFLSTILVSLKLEHYVRECEFLNFDKIKNKNNNNKKTHKKCTVI